MLFFSNTGFAQWNLNGNSVNSTDFIGTTNNEDLRFKVSNQNVMRLSVNENLIFGTNADNHKITLFDKNTNGIFIQWSNLSTLDTKFDGFIIGLNSNSLDAIIKQQENAPMLFFTDGNNERMRISANGFVGIGTNTPTALLDVSGTLRFRNGATNNYVLKSDANGNATWQALNDDNPTNEIQDLSLTGDILTLSNDATTVNLSNYLDNTDAQNLSISGHDLTIDNGNTITLPDNVDDADADSTNELQNLSVNGGNLEISGGNAIPLSSLTTSIWNENSNNDVYYNTGKVGIGLETPQSTLHIHNSTAPSGGGGETIGTQLGKSGETTSETASTIQLTNASTGSGENNGLFISSYSKSGIINLNEMGYFDIRMQDESAFKINSNKKIRLSSLEGSGERIVTVSSYGELRAVSTNSFGDNLGNHIATQDLNMNKKVILLKTVGDENHGLQYFSQLNSETIDGPGLYGFTGGFLGTKSTTYGIKKVLTWKNNGYVGIGTSNPQELLSVNGTILTKELKIRTATTFWSDFVFEKEYKLKPLLELEDFIKTNKHLPNIPTAKQVEENGIDVGEMNSKLLQKIEELTLYIIAQEKRINVLENK